MWISKKKWIQSQKKIDELERRLFGQRMNNRYSFIVSKRDEELDEIPAVMTYKAGEFEKMIYLIKTFTEPLDFSEPFKMEISYDPEKTTVTRTFLTTRCLQRYNQRLMGINED